MDSIAISSYLSILIFIFSFVLFSFVVVFSVNKYIIVNLVLFFIVVHHYFRLSTLCLSLLFKCNLGI